MGIVWKFLLDPQIGIIPHFLVSPGLPDIDFFESTTWALPAVMLVGVWKGVGFSMVIFLAALQEVPGALIEAADSTAPVRGYGSVALCCPSFAEPAFRLDHLDHRLDAGLRLST